jgi:LmbE family N-acetylglucosaminyl deacetylase
VHRRFLELRARDVTATVTSRPALVLAPHADDETIGCGATIARKVAARTPVRVVIAADGGSAVRRAECLAACAALGVPERGVGFLGLPDGGLDECGDRLASEVLAALAAVGADELYVPAAIDQHADHRALAAAVRGFGPDVLAGVTVYEYPVWLWNRWAWVDGGPPARQLAQFVRRFAGHLLTVRPRTVRTGEFLAAKRAALECYPSQLGEPDAADGLDREWLRLFLADNELFFERA